MILPFFGLATLWATFSKIWAIFFQSSGHPALATNVFVAPRQKAE